MARRKYAPSPKEILKRVPKGDKPTATTSAYTQFKERIAKEGLGPGELARIAKAGKAALGPSTKRGRTLTPRAGTTARKTSKAAPTRRKAAAKPKARVQRQRRTVRARRGRR